MSEKQEWRYCVVGNIARTHRDRYGVLRYGTPAFVGGAKVYLCGKYWDNSREKIDVIGLNRGKRWQAVYTDVSLIEHVRCAKVYKPSVLKLMGNWEYSDDWWDSSPEAKRQTAEFVAWWNEWRSNQTKKMSRLRFYLYRIFGKMRRKKMVEYLVIFSAVDEGGFVAYVPDLQINTQGKDLDEAIEMAKDAIALVCVDLEDDGKELPLASGVVTSKRGDIVLALEADLAAYRARLKQKKNV